MLINNFLMLIVLMSLGTHDAVQAEIIHGIKVPNLNITEVAGVWYGLFTSTEGVDIVTCSVMYLEKLTENSFRMHSAFTMSPESRRKSYSVDYTCRMNENSNAFVCDRGAAGKMVAVILDIQYDSYMIIYTASTIENLVSGENGSVFILGRNRHLPDKTAAIISLSNLYGGELIPGREYFRIRTDGCKYK